MAMRRAEKVTVDEGQFETTSIHLAAAILVQVPYAALARIFPTPSVDGKRLIVLTYPASQTEVIRKVVEDFHGRRLVVPLYLFNRALNLLRDRLLQDKPDHALQ